MIYKMATFPFINKILLYPHHVYMYTYLIHLCLACNPYVSLKIIKNEN
ncbi:hypothetical protein OIU77_018258 [Salix suchowensis]|uniref:Uncharacterized protein n=1 Tax=Salix suchowensis TaxID=1278906 RepID=A0ABQ8ZRR5_9ROSI|nr:hypothetical protein OIU77_018258 [Salix suchowensis]